MTDAPATHRWDSLDFGPPPSGGVEPDESVLVEHVSDGRVAVITLNRPHADNAITTEMGAHLTGILETIAVTTSIRAAVLTGAGDRAFSVGSDLRQRNAMTKEQWLRQRQDFDRTLYTLRQLRKPIIAAVNGIAYGGGSEIAQSTDFIIASDNATFGQPEAMIGLSAGGGSPGVPSATAPPGNGAADADDRGPDQRAGGVSPRHGQRAPPRIGGPRRGCADRHEDSEQLTDRSAGGQARGAARRGPAGRAGHRNHDGGALALSRAPRPQRGHRRIQ